KATAFLTRPARDSGAFDGDDHSTAFWGVYMTGFGHCQNWDWDAEEVLQFGRFHGDPILAWTASVDAGHTWESLWKPRLGTKLDATSGDRDAKDHRLGTFDALFFKSGYFNDASLIRPQNEIDVHPNLALHFSESISADGGVDV